MQVRGRYGSGADQSARASGTKPAPRMIRSKRWSSRSASNAGSTRTLTIQSLRSAAAFPANAAPPPARPAPGAQPIVACGHFDYNRRSGAFVCIEPLEFLAQSRGFDPHNGVGRRIEARGVAQESAMPGRTPEHGAGQRAFEFTRDRRPAR